MKGDGLATAAIFTISVGNICAIFFMCVCVLNYNDGQNGTSRYKNQNKNKLKRTESMYVEQFNGHCINTLYILRNTTTTILLINILNQCKKP